MHARDLRSKEMCKRQAIETLEKPCGAVCGAVCGAICGAAVELCGAINPVPLTLWKHAANLRRKVRSNLRSNCGAVRSNCGGETPHTPYAFLRNALGRARCKKRSEGMIG